MASQDFINLMTKSHTEGYKIISIKTNAKRVGDNFSIEATVVLVKDEDRLTFESSEPDFIMYLAKLRGVVDTNGEYEFKPIKNTKQYDNNSIFLGDLDKSRIEKATKEIRSSKFSLQQHPRKLVDDILVKKVNFKKNTQILIKNHHHIRAAVLFESVQMLKLQEELIKKHPEAKSIYDGVEQILMTFRRTDNALKDYGFYKNFVNFDIDELGERMSAQLPVADDTHKDFIRRKKVDAEIAIPKMMQIYANFFEISSPILNLLRIGLELKRGNNSPNKHYKPVENIGILKSDTEFGHLFSCLDEQVRHASAHASFRIDKNNRKIYFLDERGSKGKIVRTYTFDELTNILNSFDNEFFPIIYPNLVLFDNAMLVLLLNSREYIHLLLALGNI